MGLNKLNQRESSWLDIAKVVAVAPFTGNAWLDSEGKQKHEERQQVQNQRSQKGHDGTTEKDTDTRQET